MPEFGSLTVSGSLSLGMENLRDLFCKSIDRQSHIPLPPLGEAHQYSGTRLKGLGADEIESKWQSQKLRRESGRAASKGRLAVDRAEEQHYARLLWISRRFKEAAAQKSSQLTDFWGFLLG